MPETEIPLSEFLEDIQKGHITAVYPPFKHQGKNKMYALTRKGTGDNPKKAKLIFVVVT